MRLLHQAVEVVSMYDGESMEGVVRRGFLRDGPRSQHDAPVVSTDLHTVNPLGRLAMSPCSCLAQHATFGHN